MCKRSPVTRINNVARATRQAARSYSSYGEGDAFINRTHNSPHALGYACAAQCRPDHEFFGIVGRKNYDTVRLRNAAQFAQAAPPSGIAGNIVDAISREDGGVKFAVAEFAQIRRITMAEIEAGKPTPTNFHHGLRVIDPNISAGLLRKIRRGSPAAHANVKDSHFLLKPPLKQHCLT